MAGFPPMTAQGNLNRVAGHLAVASYPALNATAANMGKAMMAVTFEGPFTDQEETATGIVNSPRPFVMATIVVTLLRSQSLSGSWLSQMQAGSYLGTVTVYPDASNYPNIQLSNASIVEYDPGAFDGASPDVKVTIKGTFYVNANLWAALTGGGGTAT